MLYAYDKDNTRILAKKGAIGFCPCCSKRVKPKCGKVYTHHWSHTTSEDCFLSEPETEWHRNWKYAFPNEMVEILISKEGIKKIADVFTGKNIIELQHSTISVDEIEFREKFYGPNLIWIFDCTKQYENDQFDFYKKSNYYTFRWRHPRKTVGFVKREIYLDLGERLFHLKKIYISKPTRIYYDRFGCSTNEENAIFHSNISSKPTGGWGYFLKKNEFIFSHAQKWYVS